MNISKNTSLPINEEIQEKEIRLIDAAGNMVGIVQTKDALQTAFETNLDLVIIAPQASPPVCKIMDYGKYMFELSKKDKETRKKQKTVNIKEVRISPSIEDHDLNFKVKNATKFLQAGDKVKVSVKFRGREMNYTSLGQNALTKFAELLEEFGVIEKKPKLEGKNMFMIITPKQ